MATITKGKTFASGEVVTPQKMHDMVDLATVAGIVNADIDAAAAIAAAKLASTLDLSGKTVTLPAGQAISRPVLTGVREAIVNTGVASGTTTLNLNSGNIFQIKPNGAITIAFSNVPASGTFVGVLIRHEGDGTARTYTWPVTTKWAYGDAPATTSTNGKFDLFSLFTYDGGTTYFGQILGQNY
jgi:hypothetical protein